MATADDKLALSFTRLAPAPVNYMVESSTDLTIWTTIATLSTGSTTWSGNVIETGAGGQTRGHRDRYRGVFRQSPPIPPPAGDSIGVSGCLRSERPRKRLRHYPSSDPEILRSHR